MPWTCMDFKNRGHFSRSGGPLTISSRERQLVLERGVRAGIINVERIVATARGIGGIVPASFLEHGNVRISCMRLSCPRVRNATEPWSHAALVSGAVHTHILLVRQDLCSKVEKGTK